MPKQRAKMKKARKDPLPPASESEPEEEEYIMVSILLWNLCRTSELISVFMYIV